MRRLACVLALLAGLIWASPALAVSDPAEMLPDPAQEARARALGQQLRCLVCQNNSLEESDSDFARDMRRVIRERVRAGDDNAEVVRWMATRYGNFIRLRPEFSATTVALWASPALALLAGLAAILIGRRRRVSPPAPLDMAEEARLRRMLEK